jgi:hypothetical protein
MAAMYGSIVDALHAVDRMLTERPAGRYLIWRITPGDPWNINEMDGIVRAFEVACVSKFHDLMIVDSEIMDGIERIAEGMREGG